jgi:hypothetical protein
MGAAEQQTAGPLQVPLNDMVAMKQLQRKRRCCYLNWTLAYRVINRSHVAGARTAIADLI